MAAFHSGTPLPPLLDVLPHYVCCCLSAVCLTRCPILAQARQRLVTFFASVDVVNFGREFAHSMGCGFDWLHHHSAITELLSPDACILCYVAAVKTTHAASGSSTSIQRCGSPAAATTPHGIRPVFIQH